MYRPDLSAATAACPSCGGDPRWESVLDGDEERWLALCRCGRMRAFLPEQPALEPEDPLRAFLLGPGRPIFPPSPPWVRLFLASVEGPNPVRVGPQVTQRPNPRRIPEPFSHHPPSHASA